MLVELGLTEQHEAVYRTMLAHPELGVAGLADHLAVPVEVVREALDVLADLALVKQVDGGIRVVRPQVGLLPLLAQAEAQLALRQQQLEVTRVAISAIASSYEDRDDQVTVRRLPSLEAVRDRLVELAHQARRECLSFTTGGAQPPDTMEAEKPLNQLALERGVVIRNLYQDSLRNDPASTAHARWLAAYGSHSRTVPTLPMRMVIVDREIALVPIDPNHPRAGALELHSPGVVAALVALFEQTWETGTPFGDLPVRDSEGLTPQERQLLGLLAAGHTDESAARRLAISVRSVQRMMTMLTDRLQATSRFQAGVEAARRSWV